MIWGYHYFWKHPFSCLFRFEPSYVPFFLSILCHLRPLLGFLWYRLDSRRNDGVSNRVFIKPHWLPNRDTISEPHIWDHFVYFNHPPVRIDPRTLKKYPPSSHSKAPNCWFSPDFIDKPLTKHLKTHFRYLSYLCNMGLSWFPCSFREKKEQTKCA